MRIGTLRCMLFGHKFVGRMDGEDKLGPYTVKFFMDFCSRCGIRRPQ